VNRSDDVPMMRAALPPSVTIWPRAVLVDPTAVTWGREIIIDDFVFVGRHQRAVIGNYVHIASHASITGGGEIVIADFAGVSSGARILTGTDDFAGGALTGPCIPDEFRAITRGRVLISSHAIIGANAVVLPDIVIGEGATVGAGSVVTRDLEPWGVYAGAPARLLKKRPRESVLAAEDALYARHGRPDPSFRYPERP
jgi:acetyltransferase-like isoleucine patch superfamily enzyme